MENETETIEIIRLLEERLMRPEVRRSADDISRLLADDFVEFGSSGRILSKQEVIDGLQREDSVELIISDFRVKVFSHGVVLVTYQAIQNKSGGQKNFSLRSSVWKLIEGRWQITFHQGTPAPAEPSS